MAKVALLVFTECGEESDREESTYSLRALCNECKKNVMSGLVQIIKPQNHKLSKIRKYTVFSSNDL